MSKLNEKSYKALVKSMAKEIGNADNFEEELHMSVQGSQYSFKPLKAIELLSVSPSALSANATEDFDGPLEYDMGFIAGNFLCNMAANALEADIREAIISL